MDFFNILASAVFAVSNTPQQMFLPAQDEEAIGLSHTDITITIDNKVEFSNGHQMFGSSPSLWHLCRWNSFPRIKDCKIQGSIVIALEQNHEHRDYIQGQYLLIGSLNKTWFDTRICVSKKEDDYAKVPTISHYAFFEGQSNHLVSYIKDNHDNSRRTLWVQKNSSASNEWKKYKKIILNPKVSIKELGFDYDGTLKMKTENGEHCYYLEN